MKTLLPLMLFVVVAAASGPAAETAAPPSALAASALAGNYAGQWKGSAEGAGELRIKLSRQGEAGWTAESSFVFEGAEIPTKSKSVQADGNKVELVFEWDIQGTAGQSKLTGELTGDTLQGSYETSGAAGESRGTWSVKRA